MNTNTTKVRPGYIYALAIAIGIGFAFTLAGCEDEELPPAPPVQREPGSTSLPTRPEPEPETCPWLGTCAELEHVDGCDGWAVPCGDGWRCVDTEADAGIVCEEPGSTSTGGAP